MTLREIVTKLGFEVEHEKLTKVEQQLEAIKHRLEFLAAAEVVKGIFELTERFAKFAEELHVSATSAGLTVESLQKLGFAAKQSGIEQEEMSHSMARLSKHLYDARKGGAEAQKVFAQAGFSSEQVLRFRTGSDVMLALADRFKTIQDPIQKQAIAMQLMGRGSVNMVGFLSQGSKAIRGMGNEAERLGIVLNEKQVEALVRVEHEMNKLWGVIKGLGASIASLLAPSVETAIKEFLDFYQANKKIVEVNIKEWVWDITYAMGFVWGAVKFVTTAFLNLAKALHVDKYVGTALFAFGALVAALFAMKKAMALAGMGVDLLKFAFGPFLSVLKFVRGSMGLLIQALGWLSKSEAIAAAASAVLEAPLWLIGAAVAALILGIEALYTIFFKGGSLKDTWIGKIIDYVKSIEVVGKAISWVSGLLGKAGEGISIASAGPLASKLMGTMGPVSNLVGSATGMMSPPSTQALAGSNSVNSSYSIDAPITVNVPPGGSHAEIAKAAKDGVKEHLDRVHREAKRSLRPAVAY